MNSPAIKSVNDSVWYACCRRGETQKQCPVCFGKLFVTVILGNDEQIRTPCDYCGKGYDGPQGVVTEFEWSAKPMFCMITSVETRSDGGKVAVRYGLTEAGSAEDDLIFDTRDEAAVRCEEETAKFNEMERKRRDHSKENAAKTFSWHVGYHRRAVARAKHDLEWHSARAVSCAALAKTPIPDAAKL